MRWSKVRKLVEESFADSVKGRVAVHTTQTRSGMPYACDCGHGWLTIDGESITHFHTHLSYDIHRTPYHESTDTAAAWRRNTDLPGQKRTSTFSTHPAVSDEDRMPGNLSEPGEFSRYDLALSCWKYLHTSLQESLDSPSPIIRALAMLNGKVGRQRLARYAAAETHPLPKALAEFRIEAEAKARAAAPRT